VTKTNSAFQERFTAENTVFLFIDHQEGILRTVADQPKDQLRRSLVSVARAARVLDVPIVLSSVTPAMIGPTLPDLADALRGVPNIERTVISAWDDERVCEAVKATGRTKLVFGAIGTNVCLVQATIGAAADGYEAWAAIDLSGTSNELLRQASIEQMIQAGVGITNAAGVIFQILRDNASPAAEDVYEAMEPLLAPVG
jgi:nicotinamidase-related amidase